MKGNQPSLHKQVASLPKKAVRGATREDDCGHGRREIHTVKILTVSTGTDFPNAAQPLPEPVPPTTRRRAERCATETVYAITDLHGHQAKPAQLAAWICEHWSIENKIHWVRDVTYDEDRSPISTGTGQQVRVRFAQREYQRLTPQRLQQHRCR